MWSSSSSAEWRNSSTPSARDKNSKHIEKDPVQFLLHRIFFILEKYQDLQRNHQRYSDTMLPEGIESVHPRFAISWRNKWMLKQSDFVVTYITHTWGGAAQFAEKAKRQKKTVINLPEH